MLAGYICHNYTIHHNLHICNSLVLFLDGFFYLAMAGKGPGESPCFVLDFIFRKLLTDKYKGQFLIEDLASLTKHE